MSRKHIKDLTGARITVVRSLFNDGIRSGEIGTVILHDDLHLGEGSWLFMHFDNDSLNTQKKCINGAEQWGIWLPVLFVNNGYIVVDGEPELCQNDISLADFYNVRSGCL